MEQLVNIIEIVFLNSPLLANFSPYTPFAIVAPVRRVGQILLQKRKNNEIKDHPNIRRKEKAHSLHS